MTHVIGLSGRPKRRKPFSLVMPEDLRMFLEERARLGNRPLTREIVMRLEFTRKAAQQ